MEMLVVVIGEARRTSDHFIILYGTDPRELAPRNHRDQHEKNRNKWAVISSYNSGFVVEFGAISGRAS